MASTLQQALMPPNVILNELDEFARQWERIHRDEEETWECRRNKHRRKFRTRSDVWYFEDQGFHLKHQTAITRNLSEQGMSLMTKAVIHPLSPIEVCVALPDHPSTYLGGIVVFCRYVSTGFHEVGVALKAHAHHPIFSDDITGVAPPIPWLQEAIRKTSAKKRARKR